MHLVVSPELLRQQEREREEERLLHKMLMDGNGLKGGPLSSGSHDGIDIGMVESELSSWSLQEEQDGLVGMQEGGLTHSIRRFVLLADEQFLFSPSGLE